MLQQSPSSMTGFVRVALTIFLALELAMSPGCGEDPPVAPTAAAAKPGPLDFDRTGIDFKVLAAIDSAAKAVETTPSNPSAWGDLGMAFHAHELLPQAAHCYGRAAHFAPGEARWPYLHALVLRSTDRAGAVELAIKAADLCKDDPVVTRLRAVDLLIEQDRTEEAATHLSRAMERAPKSPRARLYRARLLFRQGKLEEAMAQAYDVGSHPAAARQARQLIAEIYQRLNKPDIAKAHRDAIERISTSVFGDDPWHDEVARRRVGLKIELNNADLRYGAGDVPGSIDLLLKTVADYPDSEWAWIYLGRAYVRLRELPKASEALNKALAINPQSVEAVFRLGVVRTLEEDHKGAADIFRKAIQMKPDFTMAHFNLGYCLEQLGDLPAAIKAYNDAVASDPQFHRGYAGLGRALHRAEQHQQAITHLRRALELEGRDTESRILLHRLLEKYPEK